MKKRSLIPADAPRKLEAQMLPEIFVTIEGGGPNDDDAYRCTFDTKEDAVDNNPGDVEWVATYKLVKVERLKLNRKVELVPA